MKILSILLLTSLIISCGQKPKDKENVKRAEFITLDKEVFKVPKIKLQIKNSLLNNYSYQSSEQDFKQSLFNKIKENGFKSMNKTSKLRQMNLVQLKENIYEHRFLHFEIKSQKKVCYLKLKIYRNQEYSEIEIFENEIRDSHFSISDQHDLKSIEYEVRDFRYCDFKISLTDYSEEYLKSHYQLNISSPSKLESYFIRSDIKVQDALKHLDPQLKLDRNKKIIRFRSQINFKKMSPLNLNDDSHGFWFSTGLMNENISYSPKAGSEINIFYIKMDNIRKSVTKEIFVKQENGYIRLPRRNSFIYRDFKIAGTIQRPIAISRTVRGHEIHKKSGMIPFKIIECNAIHNTYKYVKEKVTFDSKNNSNLVEEYLTKENDFVIRVNNIQKEINIGFITKTCEKDKFIFNKESHQYGTKKLMINQKSNLEFTVKRELKIL